MDLPLDQLRTFAATVTEGSLEGAAQRLHITPSAVSQRLRGLEERVGSVLLRRSRPVSVTEAGETVLRAARQVEQILGDVAIELDQTPTGGSVVPLVVNADSLATWFVPALARAARETGARFEVLRADETISAEKLRSGEVMAALTATAEVVPGCISTAIGVDHYYAVAHPDFVREFFPEGVNAESLAVAPQLEFDRHDMFQQRFIAKITRARVNPPRHYLPSSTEFAHAIELGMGWGMLPALQCKNSLADGTFVELVPGASLPLSLYWQRWNLKSPLIDQLSQIIAEEAARALAPVTSSGI
ncbi:MAG: LysR family transcriptional regulator ArgP [Leucobacter sp.]